MAAEPRLSCPALAPAPLAVRCWSGEEALGRPFRFEIEVARDEGAAVDLDAAMRCPATFERPGATPIHGVVAELWEEGSDADDRAIYRAVLVPRLALLGLGRESGVHRDATVPEIVCAVLERHGIRRSDVEFALARPCAPRPYTVQYEESALAFVSRLLEHEGIALRFVFVDGRDRLVLSDHDAGLEASSCRLAYRRDVSLMRCSRRAAPRTVRLRDGADGGLPLEAEASVDPAGVGAWSSHAEHLHGPEEAAALALVRAEEQRCRLSTFELATSSPGLSVGERVCVSDHPRADFAAPLLVESLRHESGPSGYRATAVCLAVDTPYRPRRVTPRPRVDGVLPARLDAVAAGASSARDGDGKYRVRMPFDDSGAAEGDASPPVAMLPGGSTPFRVEPPPGAEVLWSALGGDPDRPVLTGFAAATDGEPWALRGAPCLEIGTVSRPHTARDEAVAAQTLYGGAAEATYVRIKVPHGSDLTYARWGAAPDGELDELGLEPRLFELNVEGDQDGSFEYTSGNDSEYVSGSSDSVVHGDAKRSVGGSDMTVVLGGRSEAVLGADMRATLGLRSEASLGARVDVVAGLGSVDAKLGLFSASFHAAFAHLEWVKGKTVQISNSAELRASDRISLRVKQRPDHDKLAVTAGATVGIGAALVTAAGVGAATVASVAPGAGEAAGIASIATGSVATAATLAAGALLTYLHTRPDLAPTRARIELTNEKIRIGMGQTFIHLDHDSIALVTPSASLSVGGGKIKLESEQTDITGALKCKELACKKLDAEETTFGAPAAALLADFAKLQLEVEALKKLIALEDVVDP